MFASEILKAAVALYFTSTLTFEYEDIVFPTHLIACYEDSLSKNTGPLFDEALVQINRSIFFVETKCHGEFLEVTARQACAVESAANMNPQRDVYLLLLAPWNDSLYLDSHIRRLFEYPNFHLRHVNLRSLFNNTPMHNWYEERRPLHLSKWPLNHASDIVRYTLLWKHGGIYSDLDTIHVKSFGDLINFVGVESTFEVGSSVMSFSAGHLVSLMCLVDIFEHFNGVRFAANGPGVVTRALDSYCLPYEVRHMTGRKCRDIHVFDSKAFFAVKWEQWWLYFLDNQLNNVTKLIQDSYVLHMWNHQSNSAIVNVDSQQPYAVLAGQFCPKVYSLIRVMF